MFSRMEPTTSGRNSDRTLNLQSLSSLRGQFDGPVLRAGGAHGLQGLLPDVE